MAATSRCTLDGKYRYSVPSATSARSATSRICTASYPPSVASSIAASRMRSRRASCDAGIDRIAAVSPDTPSAPRACRCVLASDLRRPRVVSLAARRPPNLRHHDDRFRRLVAGNVCSGVRDQLVLVGGGVRTQLYDGSDPLAEPLIRDTRDHGVVDGGVCLEDGLDLFRVDLLAAGVDAHGSPAEDGDRPVR